VNIYSLLQDNKNECLHFLKNRYMKRKIILLIFCSFTLVTINGQTFSSSTIIERRAYYLNGGANASMVGGRSRVAIKIDLPPNTRKWYYSFTTTPGEDGTKLLNLGIQVAAALYSGGMATLAAKSIEVPLAQVR